MDLGLYIEGQRIELFEDENIQMTSSVQNIRDLSKVFMDFTQSFTVPASPANNLIFLHWDKAEITGFDARTRKDATMELNFQPFKKGKIQLNRVQKKNGTPVNYQLTFFGDTIQLSDSFGEDKITDLDLEAYQHTFSSANVKDGFRGGYLLGAEVIYPLISSERIWEWETETANDIKWKAAQSYGLEWQDLKPAIKLQKIVDAIQLKYGLSFSDHLFNTNEFLKLWIWASREKGNMKALGANNIVNFERISGNPAVDFTSYTTTNAFEYILYKVTPTAGFELVPYSITRVITTNSVAVPTTTNHTGTKSTHVTKETTDPITTVEFYVSASEPFTYDVTLNISTTGGPIYSGDSGATPLNASGTVNFTDYTADGITQAGQLPDLKVVDFFKGLINMFNLVVVPNGSTFTVQTLDDWYDAGEVKDLSKYMDLSTEDINRTNLYKVINFNYEEPETILQDEFEDTNDRFLGDLEYENDIDGETFEIQLPFENLVGSLLSDTSGGLTNVRMYNVINKDLEPVNTKPIVFYYTNTDAPTDDIGWWDGTTLTAVTSYNNVGQENGATQDLVTHTINWGSEMSTNFLNEMTNSLFADYWENYITDLFDENRRMFKFSGVLPSGVLANLKLNDKILVNNRRYIINQFTASLLTGKTDFELLNDVRALDITEDNNRGLQYELQTGLTG